MIPLDDDVIRSRPAPVTEALVLFNAGVHAVLLAYFVPQLSSIYQDLGFRAEQTPSLLGGASLAEIGLFLRSVVGSAFLHADWAHLAVNMAFLYRLGTAAECRLGPRRFAALYVVSAATALALHSLVILRFMPEMAGVPLIGASGAISGVIAAYALLFPGARVILVGLLLVAPIMVRLPAWFAAVLWLLLQVQMGRLALVSTHPDIVYVAWWAHLGGCAGGFLCTAVFWVAARLRRKGVGKDEHQHDR
ncbi:MAG TPA: hypothetical protein DEQ28_08730 [Clostridiales bacterium]|nr:hypothetical protein [Clostridiales bacterium]